MENETVAWERPAYWAVIPADVRYSTELTANAKLLYGEITALANKTGTCWAGNKYFSDLYGVNTDTVSRWVNELAAAGFITTKVNKSKGNQRYIRVAGAIVKNQDSYLEKTQLNNNTNNKSLNGELTKKKEDLLTLVNRVTGRSFRTLPEKGSKKTLDLFSLVEIEAALTALAADSWHKPKLKELSIDYFVRSTTIDKFKDLIPTAPIQYGTDPATGKQYYKGIEITIANQDEIVRMREEDANAA